MAQRIRLISRSLTAPRARHWLVPGYALGLTLLITGPLLAPGYLLLRDAVSTPRSYLTDAALGLGESAPRAVPQDFLVAVGSHLIGGGVVVKLLLVLGLWLAGWGAARLVSTVLPDAGPGPQLVAVTVAIWNPYVAERLLQGHWSLLVGYGCLPWVAFWMLKLRIGAPGLFGLMLFIAAAGLTPTGLLLAVTVGLVGVAVPGAGPPRWWCAAAAAAIGATAALPWLTATVSGASAAADGSAGVAAFAARAEPGLTTLGSLAGLGGIWNADAVPGSRTTPFALLATAVFVGLVVFGLPVVWPRPAARPLLVLAGAAVLMVTLLASSPGRALLAGAVDAAPGLGILRDSQKWVALAMPGYALAGAGAAVRLRRRLPSARAALLSCIALITVLPDLAWGVSGRMAPVHYPHGWAAVAGKINADPRPVAVLPADGMRRFSWAGSAPVLDPLPRWVRADVLTTGDLDVGGRTVPGEGARARTVQATLLAGADPALLAVDGVGWVVVESGTAGEMGAAARTLARLPIVYRDADLALYRVGGDAPGVSAGRRAAAVATHLGWLAMLVVGAAGLAVRPLRRALRR